MVEEANAATAIEGIATPPWVNSHVSRIKIGIAI